MCARRVVLTGRRSRATADRRSPDCPQRSRASRLHFSRWRARRRPSAARVCDEAMAGGTGRISRPTVTSWPSTTRRSVSTRATTSRTSAADETTTPGTAGRGLRPDHRGGEGGARSAGGLSGRSRRGVARRRVVGRRRRASARCARRSPVCSPSRSTREVVAYAAGPRGWWKCTTTCRGWRPRRLRSCSRPAINYLPAAACAALFGPDTPHRWFQPVEAHNHSFGGARDEQCATRCSDPSAGWHCYPRVSTLQHLYAPLARHPSKYDGV